MIRAAIGAAALVAAAPALAAEGGAIRGGEHAGFTRIVLEIEPTTEWSLETSADRATIRFPGRDLAFDTGDVFARIPQTRIRSVEASAANSGTEIAVALGCDCRVSASFVGARWLALDVADRDAATAPAPVAAAPQETPEQRARPEHDAVASAEDVLIRQIERAADQGIIRMSSPPAKTEAAAAPAPAPAPVPKTAPVSAKPMASPSQDDDTRFEQELASLLAGDQVAATTVYDRDSRAALAAQAAAAGAPPPICLPDEKFDVASWSNGQPLSAQLPALRSQLVGEFDAPDPEGLGRLARLYIRFGFGAEAESLLAGFDGGPEPEDRALLVDMARAVEGRTATPDGPLAVAPSCPGQHGLWQALGGVAPAWRDAASFVSVQAAFQALPPDLRALVGPGFAARLIDAGHPAEARVIYDTTVRPGEEQGASLMLVGARLAALDGHPTEAAQAMAGLVESDGSVSVEALTDLVRLALDERMAIPDKTVTDLRAAALQYRGDTREADLRGLLVEALARRAELTTAVAEARAAARDLPADAASFDALAVRLMTEADPASVGPAAYAGTVLDSTDLIAATAADDPARTTIARQLVALGLPDPALKVIAPTLAAGTEPARLVAAEAHVQQADPAAAQAALGTLAGPESASVRARAFALDEAYGAAHAALARGGLASTGYAWPAGDWAAAKAAAPDDPDRQAMAGWMEARGAPAPAPAADPAKLPPDQAFQQPLPPLDKPSLGAARQLLAAGGQVGGFVQGVLAGN
ncbi:MAG: hypothetical protein U1E40_01405 [Amaricoccus sp.]